MAQKLANPYQLTPEWHRARRGMLTSSRMHTIVHGGPRAWLTLIKKLQAEMASDVSLEPDLDHVPAIAWGRQYEPVALANAQLELDTDFELVGFQRSSLYDYMGCSSDALAYNRGVNVETKCPMNLAEHRRVYDTRRMPDKHRAQVQSQMIVWDVPRTLFISYHPHMPHWKLRLVIVEVEADRAYQEVIVRKCEEFMAAFRGDRMFHAPATGSHTGLPKLF
jgi:hypothetical protein